MGPGIGHGFTMPVISLLGGTEKPIIQVACSRHMYLIVTSSKDAASMNIRESLLSRVDWEEIGTFDGSPVHEHGDHTMVLIDRVHLEAELLDAEVEEALDIRPECIIVASRHKSKSGLRTLTVHPLGNYGGADFGGRARTLVPTAPRLMSQALILLKKRASGLDFQVSFECTHHGPFLNTPCFFIEIGSDEDAWREKEPAEAIAGTILALADTSVTADDVIAIGVGGGHYAPRHSDLILSRAVSMGHMLPSYALDNASLEMLEQMLGRTPECEVVYFHRKAMKKPRVRELTGMFGSLGLKVMRSADAPERSA